MKEMKKENKIIIGIGIGLILVLFVSWIQVTSYDHIFWENGTGLKENSVERINYLGYTNRLDLLDISNIQEPLKYEKDQYGEYIIMEGLTITNSYSAYIKYGYEIYMRPSAKCALENDWSKEFTMGDPKQIGPNGSLTFSDIKIPIPSKYREIPVSLEVRSRTFTSSSDYWGPIGETWYPDDSEIIDSDPRLSKDLTCNGYPTPDGCNPECESGEECIGGECVQSCPVCEDGDVCVDGVCTEPEDILTKYETIAYLSLKQNKVSVKDNLEGSIEIMDLTGKFLNVEIPYKVYVDDEELFEGTTPKARGEEFEEELSKEFLGGKTQKYVIIKVVTEDVNFDSRKIYEGTTITKKILLTSGGSSLWESLLANQIAKALNFKDGYDLKNWIQSNLIITGIIIFMVLVVLMKLLRTNRAN